MIYSTRIRATLRRKFHVCYCLVSVEIVSGVPELADSLSQLVNLWVFGKYKCVSSEFDALNDVAVEGESDKFVNISGSK